MKNAIILCSGGSDSSVTAYYVKKKLGYKKLIILFFDYGQRTLGAERKSAQRITRELNAEFREIKIPELAKISTSLINSKIKAKKVKRKQLKDTEKESQDYYVPCRNSVFLIYALGLAEALQIKKKQKWDIFTGFKCEGKDAYPDTTQEFIKQINRLRKTATAVKGKIMAPLIKKDKDEIIKLGNKLGVKLEGSFSCYIGPKVHCGTCLACRLRQEAFYWANIKDLTRYKEKMADYRAV